MVPSNNQEYKHIASTGPICSPSPTASNYKGYILFLLSLSPVVYESVSISLALSILVSFLRAQPQMLVLALIKNPQFNSMEVALETRCTFFDVQPLATVSKTDLLQPFLRKETVAW